MSAFGLPRDPPACFPDKESWNQYKACVSDPSRDFTYCEDCTAKYQAKMRTVGRCSHPETVFLRVNEELVGKRVEWQDSYSRR